MQIALCHGLACILFSLNEFLESFCARKYLKFNGAWHVGDPKKLWVCKLSSFLTLLSSLQSRRKVWKSGGQWLIKRSFEGTGFASNSAKNWEGNCPLGPHSSTVSTPCALLHSSILDSTQSYNPPQLSSAHRCAGTVFNMESLKTSVNVKVAKSWKVFSQYETKWKEVFEIKPPLKFSRFDLNL